MSEWILTDDDCCQYVKKLDDTVFKLIQISSFGYDGKSTVYAETIDLDDYDEDDILKTIQGYGYDSVDNVIAHYDDYANQVIAEYLFESRVCCLPHRYCGTQAECEDFVKEYIQNH